MRSLERQLRLLEEEHKHELERKVELEKTVENSRSPADEKFVSRFSISIIGTDLAFFSIAHTPARGAPRECRVGTMSPGRAPRHRDIFSIRRCGTVKI